jgi:hypothetical protein
MVLVPGPRVWKIKRTSGLEMEQRTTLDSNDQSQFSEDQMQNKFAGMTSSLFGSIQSTGMSVSLGDIFASSSSAAGLFAPRAASLALPAPPSQPKVSSPAPATHFSPQPFQFGIAGSMGGLGFSCPPPRAEVTATQEASGGTEVKAKGKRTSKAGVPKAAAGVSKAKTPAVPAEGRDSHESCRLLFVVLHLAMTV